MHIYGNTDFHLDSSSRALNYKTAIATRLLPTLLSPFVLRSGPFVYLPSRNVSIFASQRALQWQVCHTASTTWTNNHFSLWNQHPFLILICNFKNRREGDGPLTHPVAFKQIRRLLPLVFPDSCCRFSTARYSI